MNFKELRIRQKLSLRDAAKKIGVSFQSICRYENKGRIPKGDILLRMTKVYKCTNLEIGQAVMDNLQNGEKKT